MIYRNALLIYNPKAGKGLIHQNLASIVETASENGFLLTVIPTTAKGSFKEIFHSLDLINYDRIICSGGDGTLNEAVSSLIALSINLPLGYIPAGSTNDFASSLGLPSNMVTATKIATSHSKKSIDIASFNNQYFVYVAAFGMFTDVAYSTDQNLKNIFGHLAYVMKGASEIKNIKPYHMRIEYDDDTIEGYFILGFISSTTSIGGILNLSSLDVSFDDGFYEVVLIKSAFNNVESSTSTDSIAIGTDLIERNIITFKTSKLHITSFDEAPWTLDGEYGGSPKEISIDVQKKVIDIFAP